MTGEVTDATASGIHAICGVSGCEVVELNVQADHVDLVAMVPPKVAISDLLGWLRHTAASRLVQSGVDLYLVQRILGHSTPTMTARYSHLAGDNLAEAMQRMERAKIKKSGAKVIPLRPATGA